MNDRLREMEQIEIESRQGKPPKEPKEQGVYKGVYLTILYSVAFLISFLLTPYLFEKVYYGEIKIFTNIVDGTQEVKKEPGLYLQNFAHVSYYPKIYNVVDTVSVIFNDGVQKEIQCIFRLKLPNNDEQILKIDKIAYGDLSRIIKPKILNAIKMISLCYTSKEVDKYAYVYNDTIIDQVIKYIDEEDLGIVFYQGVVTF